MTAITTDSIPCPRKRARAVAASKNQHEHVLKLLKQDLPGGNAVRGLQFVGTKLLQAPFGLDVGKPSGPLLPCCRASSTVSTCQVGVLALAHLLAQ